MDRRAWRLHAARMFEACAEVHAAYPWFFTCVFFCFGAAIGSFLNVCILRIPAGKSLVRPGSTCACGKPIAWHDNIPILGWLLLRGKARCCGARFSVRYPLIELGTGLLFVACWLSCPPAKALCGMLFVSCLVCISFIDLDHMIIPESLNLGLGVIGVLLSVLVPSLHGQASEVHALDCMRSGLDGLLGLLVGSGLILWIALLAEALLKKEAMGFGDVILLGSIGAFTGWQGAVFTLFGGAFVGTIWFIVALLIEKITGRRRPEVLKAETPEGKPADLSMGAQVPYGPMLSIAGVLYFLWLEAPARAWFAEVQTLFGPLP
jgi:leader peptidase (prepilin peptidase) / N-methyltransferase